MASATAVAPPATDPNYRSPLEPAGPPQRARSASAPLDKDTTANTTATTAKSTSGRGSRRVSVILHGKRADEPDVRAAVATLRSEGRRVDVKVTWESGDVEKFVKDIIRDKSADTIVAAGGDGTLNEVVAALIKVRAPRYVAVGLMPMGTSNDFAAVTGIPQDLEGALRLCTRSDNLRELDVGLLNGEVFMNTATLGASSELGSETSQEAKKLLGPAAYLVKGMAKLAAYSAVPVRMRFPKPANIPLSGAHSGAGAIPPGGQAAAGGGAGRGGAAPIGGGGGGTATGGGVAGGDGDGVVPLPTPPAGQTLGQAAGLGQAVGLAGEKEQRGGAGGGRKEGAIRDGRGDKKTMEVVDRVLNITAGNSRQLASMLQACPDALLDDGLLDITYVTGDPLESATTVVGEILTHGLEAAQPDNVHLLRVPWLRVDLEAEDPELLWPGNRDGEPVPPSRSYLLEALSRRITMHLPDSCRGLLAEGADPRVNAPVIAANRLRRGVVKAMVAQVTRFRRIIPGSRPWWQSAALDLVSRMPTLLLGAVAGYVVAGSMRRSAAGKGEGAGARTKGPGPIIQPAEATDKTELRERRRIKMPMWPLWPIGRGRRVKGVVGV